MTVYESMSDLEMAVENMERSILELENSIGPVLAGKNTKDGGSASPSAAGLDSCEVANRLLGTTERITQLRRLIEDMNERARVIVQIQTPRPPVDVSSLRPRY